MKILISDKLAEAGIKICKEKVETDVRLGMSEDELCECISEYDGLIIRSATKVTAKVIEHASKLQIIARAGVGVDNIDIPEATRKGIVVANTPEGNTIAAAELTIALMMSMMRNIPPAHSDLINEKWTRSSWMGSQCYQKTLGIIGLGRIGARVGKIASGLQMKVLGHDPFLKPEVAKQRGIEWYPMEELLEKCDIITLHVPLTADTQHMISEKEISKMKDGARLVNCSRGGVVDEDALCKALESGKLAGAALDVYEKEPLPPESSLRKMSHLVLTPHLGASTVEAQISVAVDAAEQVLNVLDGGYARSAINLPALPPEELKPLEPYFPCAYKLGKLVAVLNKELCTSLTLTFAGELCKLRAESLTSFFLKGLLAKVVPETINLVNASVVAREKGIEIKEERRDKAAGELGNFQSLLRARVTTADGKEKSYAVTIFPGGNERIIEIDGFRVNAVPEGFLILLPNLDRPGTIGRVGTYLGEKKINIAFMEVGRKTIGGEAVMVINCDNKADEGILEGLSKLEGITGIARLVEF